ncbi:hypothetical protein VULLAG_LOCUS18285 [Vulpes lagopus]
MRRKTSAIHLKGLKGRLMQRNNNTIQEIIIEILEDCTKASGRERRYEGRHETLPEEAHTRITEKEPVDKYRRAAEEGLETEFWKDSETRQATTTLRVHGRGVRQACLPRVNPFSTVYGFESLRR